MHYNSTISKIVKNEWKKAQIKSITRLFKGFKIPIFDVKIENPKKEVVIKLIEDELFEKRGIKEKNVAKLLLSRFPDFPTPRIIRFDDSRKLIDFPFIIEEKIPGIDLADIDLTKINNKKEFITSFAKFAGQMNSIHYTKFGHLDEKLKIKQAPWSDIVRKELTEYIGRIEENNYLDEHTLQKVKEYLEQNKHLMNIKNKPRFIHNDYHGNNIKAILIDGRCMITGIFDFESCMSGDPIKELYKAEWVLSALPEYRKYFYREYSTYVKLPKDYKKRLKFYAVMGRLKHIQYRARFETSPEGKKTIKEGIRVIKKISLT